MAKACCLPSAIIATNLSFSMLSAILAPGEVRPGHIMFAPLKTNFIAPLSTCCWVMINGYWCNRRRVARKVTIHKQLTDNMILASKDEEKNAFGFKMLETGQKSAKQSAKFSFIKLINYVIKHKRDKPFLNNLFARLDLLFLQRQKHRDLVQALKHRLANGEHNLRINYANERLVLKNQRHGAAVTISTSTY
uniref:Uncharacterized protein n=1 Tax=Romanomermis culicivorax TaxID=13658 RepID=A0A915JMW1_ROMCU